MKRRLSLAVLFLGVAVFSFTFTNVGWKIKPVHEGKEDADEAAARERFEWKRLRDPATGRIPDDIRAQELAFAKRLPSIEAMIASRLQKSGAASVIKAATWTARGPWNVGGRTRALAVDLQNDNVILGGGISGGMWRSTDGGTSWARTTNLLDSIQSVTCVAQDRRLGKQNTWYYGTGENVGNSASAMGGSYRGDGIFKSTDDGVTWRKLRSTATGTPQTWIGDFAYVWNVVTNPVTTQDEVYAAVYGGVKRSTDGGSSWTTVLGDMATGEFSDIAVTSTGVFYATLSSDASVQKGIFRSTDGATWTNITPAQWPTTFRRIVIGLAPSNESVVYFLAETPGSGKLGHSFWKYTDNGAGTGTWADRSAGIPSYGKPVGDFDSQGSYDLLVRVKPNNANAVFIGGTNLYRSMNGFADTLATTWIGGYGVANDISRYANHHPDQHALTFLHANSAVMLSGCDGGISITANDTAATVVWTSLDNGYVTSQFYHLAIDHATSGNNIIVGGLQDNGTWFTNATTTNFLWKELDSGDGGFAAIADGRTSYYTSSQNGNITRQVVADNGTMSSWAVVTPANATGFLFVTPYVLNPNNTNMMFLAAGNMVWRNNDLTAIPAFDQNKTMVNWDSLGNTAIGSVSVSALVVSRSPANRLYYGGDNGKVYRLDNANVGNGTPQDISGVNFPANAYVSCIAVDPTNADNAMVVFSNYNIQSLFFTTNGGTSWTAVGGNLEENADGTGRGPSCRWAAILPVSGTTYYLVGTSTGVYSTTTLSGATTQWALEGASSIGNVVVNVIDTRPLDGLVVVGTHGNGVFSATFTGATGVLASQGAQPKTIALEQNFPNPFNPSTVIRYTLPEKSAVRLRVFDVSGKEVATLVQQEQEAGTYDKVWDGRNAAGGAVASGVYFARLESGSRTRTQKMMLLK